MYIFSNSVRYEKSKWPPLIHASDAWYQEVHHILINPKNPFCIKLTESEDSIVLTQTENCPIAKRIDPGQPARTA